MALQAITGHGQFFGHVGPQNAPSFTATAISATGDKLAWAGPLYIPSGTSKNVTRVGFRAGNVVSAGGSGMTISLQALTTASGPPLQPSGTQLKTAALALNTVTSNTWVRSAAFASTLTVNPGDKYAVVIEFDGGGRLGADSLQMSNVNANAAAMQWQQSAALSQVSGTWSAVQVYPNIVLEADDGTFLTVAGGIPASAVNTHTFNNGSASNEIALAFQVPFSCKVDGAYLQLLPAASASFAVNLYDGTSVMTGGSLSFDFHNVVANTTKLMFVPFTAPVTLVANRQYDLAVTPSTANNVSIYSFDVNAAAHLALHPGGQNWNYSTRSGGSWAANTKTRRLLAGIHISHLDDGASGFLAPPPMVIARGSPY